MTSDPNHEKPLVSMDELLKIDDPRVRRDILQKALEEVQEKLGLPKENNARIAEIIDQTWQDLLKP